MPPQRSDRERKPAPQCRTFALCGEPGCITGYISAHSELNQLFAQGCLLEGRDSWPAVHAQRGAMWLNVVSHAPTCVHARGRNARATAAYARARAAAETSLAELRAKAAAAEAEKAAARAAAEAAARAAAEAAARAAAGEAECSCGESRAAEMATLVGLARRLLAAQCPLLPPGDESEGVVAAFLRGLELRGAPAPLHRDAAAAAVQRCAAALAACPHGAGCRALEAPPYLALLGAFAELRAALGDEFP